MSEDRPVGRASWWLRSQDRGTLIFAALAALVILALLYILLFVGNDDPVETSLVDDTSDQVSVVEPAATSTPAELPTAVVEPTAVVIPTAIPTPEPTAELITTTEDLVEGADNADNIETEATDSGSVEETDSSGSSDSSGSTASGDTGTVAAAPAPAAPRPTATPPPTAVPTPRPRPTPCVRDSIGNCAVDLDKNVSSQTLAADATPTPGGPTAAPAEPPTGSVSASCDAVLLGESLISFAANNNGYTNMDVIVSVGGVVTYPSLNAPAGTTVIGLESLAAGFQVIGQSGQSIAVESIDGDGNVTLLATGSVPTC